MDWTEEDNTMIQDRGGYRKVRSFALSRNGTVVAKIYHRYWDDSWEAYAYQAGAIHYRGTFPTLEQAQERCSSAR